MDIIISLLVAEGVPTWVLHHALRATGLHGAARFTTAFSALGPRGMLSGLVTLGAIQAVSFFLSEAAIERIYLRVVRQLRKEGVPPEDILKTIDGYRVSRGLKERLREEIVVRTYLLPN